MAHTIMTQTKPINEWIRDFKKKLKGMADV